MSPELELHALAGAFALDALDTEERTAFEEHLTDCDDCLAEVRGLREAAAELSQMTAAAPPPRLRADVLSAIGQVRPLPPVLDNVVALRQAKAGRSAWQLLAAACALIAILASGWGYQQHRQAQRAAPQASAIEAVLAAPDSAAVSGAVGAGNATLVYSRSAGKIVLVAHGIPALPASTTYQLWALAPTGAAVSAGLFQPDAKGDAKIVVAANLVGASEMGVSVEPAGGSATPTPGQVKSVMRI